MTRGQTSQANEGLWPEDAVSAIWAFESFEGEFE
jgi:hypothetical protein